jgi:hypothetical protein
MVRGKLPERAGVSYRSERIAIKGDGDALEQRCARLSGVSLCLPLPPARRPLSKFQLKADIKPISVSGKLATFRFFFGVDGFFFSPVVFPVRS